MKRFLTRVACALITCASIAGVSRAADPAPVADVPRISQAELLTRLEKQDESVVVLDVRTPAEFAAGHVPGARNVSHDQLGANLAELETMRDTDVVLYCRSGKRALIAADTLRKAGFTKLLHLDGDYLAWEAQKQPVESEPAAAPAQ